MDNLENLAKRWWVQAATPVLDKRVQNKKIKDALYNAAQLMKADTTGLDKVLKQYLPRKSKLNAENVAYFDNSYKYQAERLTVSSSGSFFKKLFPVAPDNMVEAFTIFWKDNIAFDSSEYTLSVGNTQEDFVNAFTKYRRTAGLNYNYDDGVKSISDSCMRHAFDAMPIHPAAVYASGDFEVVVVRDKKGKHWARCVVYNSPTGKIHNYIYGANNYSVDLIKAYLEEHNSRFTKKDEWHGAKLVKISENSYKNCRYFLCPYIDSNRYVLDYDDNHLIIVSDVYRRDNKKFVICNGTCGTVYLDRSDDSKYGVNTVSAVRQEHSAREETVDIVIVGRREPITVSLRDIEADPY